MIPRTILILSTPGIVSYILTYGVMSWPWPVELFPFMAPESVPLAIARLVTGWWFVILAALIFGIVCGSPFSWKQTAHLCLTSLNVGGEAP